MWRKSQPIESLLNLTAPQKADETPLLEAVFSLPGMYREVVLLYYEQDMSLREIADMLHLSANTVSTRLRRARRRLEKALKGEIAP